MASANTTRLPPSALETRATDLDRRWHFEPSLEKIAGRHVDVDLDLLAVEPLSDQFAPVNYLVRFDAQ